jgi:hypothetical protein
MSHVMTNKQRLRNKEEVLRGHWVKKQQQYEKRGGDSEISLSSVLKNLQHRLCDAKMIDPTASVNVSKLVERYGGMCGVTAQLAAQGNEGHRFMLIDNQYDLYGTARVSGSFQTIPVLTSNELIAIEVMCWQLWVAKDKSEFPSRSEFPKDVHVYNE